MVVNSFPQSFEILEYIFLRTPGDLKELRLTCKLFYQVICGSLPLMKKLNFRWYKSEENLKVSSFFLDSGGKFCNVEFYRHEDSDTRITKFIDTNANTLTTLSFTSCRFSTSDLQQMLSYVAETLKELASWDQSCSTTTSL